MIRGEQPTASGVPPATVASSAGDAELRRFVEASLGTRIDELVRRPLAQATSFPCEILGVRAGGHSFELFFKDFGSCRLPRSSGSGAEREIEVYRRLLDPAVLGTPRYLGSLREGRRDWLLLEHVRGARLAPYGPPWLAAATWLAELQAHAATSDLARRGAPFLVLHDAAHLQATTHEAVKAVAQVDHSLVHPLLDGLEDYEVFLDPFADEPRTFVHGSYRPENILVDEQVLPARVALVDWEHAASGCALYDIAFLTAGLEREKAEGLVRAFTTAAAERGLAVPTGERAWFQVTTLRVHKFLRSLGRAVPWGYSRATVARIVELIGSTCLELRSALRAEVRSRSGVPATAGRAAAAHPALRAWRALGLEQGGADRVERIEGRYFGRKRRVVYRLGGIGPQGSPVVVKRCPRAVGALEHRVYTELLPELRVSMPRCHGWLEEGESGWLFVEDVGTRRLSAENEAHRACALDWLARLHGASARILPPARLPDRGVGHHLALLREARQLIHGNLGNPALSEQDREAARGVIATCEQAEASWGRLEAACAAMPVTYVHGDFRPKNLFLRGEGAELTLLPIDWEYSGWSVPALDLGSLLLLHGHPAELSSYRAALEPLVPGLGEAELWTWVWAGRALRAVSSIYWTRKGISFPYFEQPLKDLRLYCDILERAFEELAASAPARGPCA